MPVFRCEVTGSVQSSVVGKGYQQLQGVGVHVCVFPTAVNTTERRDWVDACEKFSFGIAQPEMAGFLGEECGAGWTKVCWVRKPPAPSHQVGP